MADSITLQYSTTSAWQSHLIRIMCHSPFSHVDVVMDDGRLYGASDPGGVTDRPPNYEVFLTRHRLTIKTDKADAIWHRLLSQKSKPFDDTALHAFLHEDTTNQPAIRDWRDLTGWFCSELVTWSFEDAGFFPYNLAFPFSRITPNDSIFLLNPYFDTAAFAVEYTGP